MAVIDAHGFTIETADSATTAKEGLKVTTKTACTLTKITKHASNNANTAYLHDSGHSELASASFSGNDATFSYSLANATSYYVLTRNADSSMVNTRRTTSGGASYPVSGTNVDWVAGSSGGSDYTDFAWNIVSITTDAIVGGNQNILLMGIG